MRHILFIEPKSGLRAKCELLDEQAPRSAEFLWQLGLQSFTCDAMHAIWTGPELSVPLPASILPETLASDLVPAENATSFPNAGEIVLASLAAGSKKGLPPGNFFDIGVFYGQGGRMLMPFGWIEVNVCAKIVDADMVDAVAAIKSIQKHGACRLTIEACQ